MASLKAMSDKAPPLSGKDHKEIQKKLNDNALFVSLMMASPVDALAAAGHKFKAADFENISPPTSEDAHLIKILKEAIGSGETRLSSPIVIQPAPDADSLRPPQPQAKSKKAPDITLSVSGNTIQYALKRFTQDSFKGQIFSLPDLEWWSISAKGDDIFLELKNDSALVKATFTGTIEFVLWLLGIKLANWKSEFPIAIEILASFSIDEYNLLYLSIAKGQISMVNAPFPARLTADLIAKITSIVPYIPLIKMPTSFSMPGVNSYAENEVDLELSGISISEKEVGLQFQISESPLS